MWTSWPSSGPSGASPAPTPREAGRERNVYSVDGPTDTRMETVLVPVRYPLSEHSARTLGRAVDVAEERDAELIVLHVDLYQEGHEVTRNDLKAAVESEVGHLPNARYLVDRAFLVEEQILEEVVAEEPDVVVLGHKQWGRWRGALHRLRNDPDIAAYLQREVDAEFVIVEAE